MVRETAIQQREGELLFSLLVQALSLAVTAARKSPHAAFVVDRIANRRSIKILSIVNEYL